MRRGCSLADCLRLFMRPEALEEDDAWRCPDCRKPVNASKQMSLWRPPPLLCLSLKRFSYANIYLGRKIDQLVKFPVEELDLKDYLSPGSDAGEVVYDLYGVVNHSGSLCGGHYTSCGRLVNQDNSTCIDWRHFNDSWVSKASDMQLVSSSAYVLFYRRRGFQFTLQVPASLVQEEEEPACEEEEEEEFEEDSDEDPFFNSSNYMESYYQQGSPAEGFPVSPVAGALSSPGADIATPPSPDTPDHPVGSPMSVSSVEGAE